MMETIVCPACERRLLLPEEALGTEVKCPACQETFTAARPGATGSSPVLPRVRLSEPLETAQENWAEATDSVDGRRPEGRKSRADSSAGANAESPPPRLKIPNRPERSEKRRRVRADEADDREADRDRAKPGPGRLFRVAGIIGLLLAGLAAIVVFVVVARNANLRAPNAEPKFPAHLAQPKEWGKTEAAQIAKEATSAASDIRDVILKNRAGAFAFIDSERARFDLLQEDKSPEARQIPAMAWARYPSTLLTVVEDRKDASPEVLRVEPGPQKSAKVTLRLKRPETVETEVWHLSKASDEWRLYDVTPADIDLRLSALTGLQAAIESKHFNPASRTKASLDFNETVKAVEFLRYHDLDTAAQSLAKIQTRAFGVPKADSMLAFAKSVVALKNREQANRVAEELQALKQSYSPPLLDYYLAFAHNEANKPAEALPLLKEFENAVGDTYLLQRELGYTYRLLGRAADAAAAYRKALKYSPKDAESFLELIRVAPASDPRQDFADLFLALDKREKNFQVVSGDCVRAKDGRTLDILCGAMRKAEPKLRDLNWLSALAKAWTRKPKEAQTYFKAALTEIDDVDQRKVAADEFRQALILGNAALEAYEMSTNPREDFVALATTLVEQYRPADLSKLVKMHGGKHADDPSLSYFQAELAANAGEYHEAEKLFAKAFLAPAPGAAERALRPSRVAAKFYTNQSEAAIANIPPARETFQQLASLLQGKGDYAGLQKLVEAHNLVDPDDRQMERLKIAFDVREKKYAEAYKRVKDLTATPPLAAGKGVVPGDLPINAKPQPPGEIFVFFTEMFNAGAWKEAYELADDSRLAFRHLSARLRTDGGPDALRELIRLHSRKDPLDPRLKERQATSFIEDKKYQKAVDLLRPEIAQAALVDRWELENTYYRALVKLKRAVEAYREADPSRDPFTTLASLVYQERDGEQLEALVREHREKSKANDNGIVDEYDIRSKVLQKKFDEARETYLQRSKVVEKTDAGFLQRAWLDAMNDQDKGLEAYAAAQDRTAAFSDLATTYELRKKHGELEKLIGEHAKAAGRSDLVDYYEGVLRLAKGDAANGEPLLERAYKNKDRVLPPGEYSRLPIHQLENDRDRVKVKLGKTLAHYHDLGGDHQAFARLADVCYQEKDAKQLEELLKTHREKHPGFEQAPAYQLRIHWLRGEHEEARKLIAVHDAQMRHHPRQVFIWESLDLRVMAKAGQTDAAIERIKDLEKRMPYKRSLRALVLAETGRVKELIQFFEEHRTDRYLVDNCYANEDFARIVASEPFAEVRKRFPDPLLSRRGFLGDFDQD